MGRKADDIAGKVFGRWTALSYAGPGPDKRGALWNCRCACGVEKQIIGGDLRRGCSLSCGCALKDYQDSVRTHGLAKHPMCAVWHAIRSRCRNRKNKWYANYGGRGIVICDRYYGSLNELMADLGERPSPDHTTVDRRDNEAGYTCGKCDHYKDKRAAVSRALAMRPTWSDRKIAAHIGVSNNFVGDMRRELSSDDSSQSQEREGKGGKVRAAPRKANGWEQNLRWATKYQQAHNKRNNVFIEYKGEIRCLTEWSRITGIPHQLISGRLKRGRSNERALSPPKKRQGKR